MAAAKKRQAKQKTTTRAAVVKLLDEWALNRKPGVTMDDIEFLDTVKELCDRIFHDKQQPFEDQMWAVGVVVEIIDFKLTIATQGVPGDVPMIGRRGDDNEDTD